MSEAEAIRWQAERLAQELDIHVSRAEEGLRALLERGLIRFVEPSPTLPSPDKQETT